MNWKPYLGKYEVNERGDVRNVNTGNILKHELDKNGHLRVTLYNGKPCKRRVSIIVLSLFRREKKENEVVEFLDQNPLNIHLDNLKWSTRSKLNRKYPKKFQTGSKVKRSKLTELDIPLILDRRWRQRHRLSDIANDYDVGISTIHGICSNRSWKTVECKERDLIPKRLRK